MPVLVARCGGKLDPVRTVYVLTACFSVEVDKHK